jgi:hypothetical protein
MSKLLTIVFLTLTSMAIASSAHAQPCSICDQMEANGEYDCEAVRYAHNECIRRVQDAASKCRQTCINYNGIGPVNPPRGQTVK